MQKSHCQICAREIKANTGVIAHHGYQRPGYGWQTGSCFGARHLPYEESRDLIPRAIESYKVSLKNNEEREVDLMANPPETLEEYNRYTHETSTYERPEDFDPEKAVSKGSFMYTERYDREFRKAVKTAQQNIVAIKQDLEYLQKRYDEWVKVR